MRFRADDESLCAWVTRPNHDASLSSFDVDSADYARAASGCLATVAAVLQTEPRLGVLEEVGATDDEGYLVVAAEDFEKLHRSAGLIHPL